MVFEVIAEILLKSYIVMIVVHKILNGKASCRIWLLDNKCCFWHTVQALCYLAYSSLFDIANIFVCPMLCNAWTEYIFTCVCVCVCVSIKLSVNSPQRIFTVDSLKDADLRKRRKDVPFGGLDYE